MTKKLPVEVTGETVTVIAEPDKSRTDICASCGAFRFEHIGNLNTEVCLDFVEPNTTKEDRDTDTGN
jgi:hypothetical protein